MSGGSVRMKVRRMRRRSNLRRVGNSKKARDHEVKTSVNTEVIVEEWKKKRCRGGGMHTEWKGRQEKMDAEKK